MSKLAEEFELLQMLENTATYEEKNVKIWCHNSVINNEPSPIFYNEIGEGPQLNIIFQKDREIILTEDEDRAKKKLLKLFEWEDRLSNNYVRMCGKFEIERKAFKLILGPTLWTYAKLRESLLTNTNLDSLKNYSKEIEILRRISNKYLLNALGVRVLLVTKDGQIVLQRRSSRNNTFPSYLDLTASGYIDSEKHSYLGNISLHKAMMMEIIEEFGLAEDTGPDYFTFEGYELVGLSRYIDTGQVDIFGFWRINKTAEELEEIRKSENLPSSRVDTHMWFKADESKLQQIMNSDQWVPHALIPLKLMLPFIKAEHNVKANDIDAKEKKKGKIQKFSFPHIDVEK